MMVPKFNRSGYVFSFVVVLLSIYGCAFSAPELVSEISVEDKIAKLKIGQSDKTEVESIFGVEHGSDRTRWAYNFDDRQFEISERRQGPGLGAIPVSAGVVPINTRAVVTLTFNPAGIVKRIEVARFFEEPFINDYWYLIKAPEKEALEPLAQIGESVGFKVIGLDKTAGVFALEDPNSKVSIVVRLEGQILRVTTKNPHHRLANEYRAYSKRESALTNGIVDSELVQ